MGESRAMDLINRLEKIFEDEKKLEEEIKKIKIKSDKIFNEKAKIAFYLYSEFIKNNSEFNKNSKYFKLYIDNGYFMVEELVFSKIYNNIIEFNHKSKYRQNHFVNLFLDIKQVDYTSNSVVVDEKQLDRLSKYFKVIVRE
jgi:hypothetical protein